MFDNMTNNDEMKVKCKGGGSIIKQAPIFSPDSEYLYIPWKNLLRCYNVSTGERISDLEGCENDIICARFHPTNNALLVGCSVTGEIAIWKWHTRLLISVHKIKCKIEEVVSFHLLPLHSDINNDCDILLCWQYQHKYYLRLFTLKKLEYKSKEDIILRKKIKSVDVGSLNKSPFIAAIDDNNVVCVKVDGTKKLNCKVGERANFTCLVCHPEKNCIATGDTSGRVIVWNGLFSSGAPAKTIYHWHTLPVNTLLFSQTGTVLYSGGNECVIVKWQLDGLNKNFLPRLPAPILYFSSAQGNAYIAVSTKDNAIHIVDTQFRTKSVIQHLTWAVSFSAGIKIDPRTKSLVMNGHIGNIQFYCPFTMSLLYNLDVVGQNKLTEERNSKIPNTNISKIALTKLGNWLACIENRIDNEVYHEIRLKFFQFDVINQSFALNTSVEYPHENGINSLEFQPICNSLDLYCATAGNDNQFKIWSLVDTSDIYRKSYGWRCWSNGYYKSLPCNALSFSSDGSLLMVAFGPCLTAWSPDSCELKCSLVHSNFRAPLKLIQCGNAEQCHLVVTASSDRICVWNLLTLSLVWTVPVKVVHLCADPLSIYMAAFTINEELFIFSPGSSSPVFYRKKITSNNKIVAATFVPRISENSEDVLWRRLSQLYFINSNQELLCLESSNDLVEDIVLNYTPQSQKSAVNALIAESTVVSSQEKNSIFHSGQGLSGATEIKQLLEPSVHTMAPMRHLCNSVLRSLITREGDVQEEEIQDDEQTFPKNDFHNESESDNETQLKKKNSKVPKEEKRANNLKKHNLKSVFSESYKWTKILID